MNFVAFDFETANEYRTSACSIGIAVINNGYISESKHFLIKPEPFYFNDFNTMIHGITPEMVENSPTFAELWSTLKPYFENQIVVAHNSSFDISVLRQTLSQYDISAPEMQILCTYRISQAAFPELSSYKLNILSDMLNIELEHHNAESDAVACALILQNIMDSENLSSLTDLSEKYSVQPGYISFDEFKHEAYCPCRVKNLSSHKAAKSTKKQLDEIAAEYIDDDFNGKGFAFTGTLLSMTREQALTLVAKSGGIPCPSVTRKTNYLVTGIQDISRLGGHSNSSKFRKADELRAEGYDIKIIDENEFLRMLDDDIYNASFTSQANAVLETQLDARFESVNLSNSEILGVSTILDALSKYDVSQESISLERRSDNYLSIIAGDDDFLRLKMGVNSKWFSIRITKEFKQDNRLADVTNKNQFHWKVPIDSEQDLYLYSDIIYASYLRAISK